MKRTAMIFLVLLLTLSFAVSAEANDRRYHKRHSYNNGGSNTIVVPLLPIPIPVPVIPDNGGYYGNGYRGGYNGYYQDNGYNSCGWVTIQRGGVKDLEYRCY